MAIYGATALRLSTPYRPQVAARGACLLLYTFTPIGAVFEGGIISGPTSYQTAAFCTGILFLVTDRLNVTFSLGLYTQPLFSGATLTSINVCAGCAKRLEMGKWVYWVYVRSSESLARVASGQHAGSVMIAWARALPHLQLRVAGVDATAAATTLAAFSAFFVR